MDAQELILNIAVNMGRIGRFSLEGKAHRVEQFIKENNEFLGDLDKSVINDKFKPTLKSFKTQFEALKNKIEISNEAWAEAAYTWANILTHRAKLA